MLKIFPLFFFAVKMRYGKFAKEKECTFQVCTRLLTFGTAD